MSPLVRLSCGLTVPRSRSGILTKRIALRSADGWQVSDFSAGAWFAVHRKPVSSLTELALTLDLTSRTPYAAIVRGKLLPGVDAKRCRRLSNWAAHGDAVTFAPCARCWIGIDVDGLEEPPCCTFATELEDGVEHAVLRLPDPFHDVSCWWQDLGEPAGARVRAVAGDFGFERRS